jgi:hypothetical protein
MAETYFFKVVHPDGEDLGLSAPVFDTEKEAAINRDTWNQDYPGHYIIKESRP